MYILRLGEGRLIRLPANRMPRSELVSESRQQYISLRYERETQSVDVDA